MALWRALLFLLAFPLAWYFGPDVIDGLVAAFPFLAGIFAFLFPSLDGRGAADYLKVALAFVVLWVLMGAAGVFFGFALPNAQRYTTTKAVRRLQGVCAELSIFAFFALLVVWSGVSRELGRERILDQLIEAERAELRDSTVAGLQSDVASSRDSAAKALRDLFAAEDELFQKIAQAGLRTDYRAGRPPSLSRTRSSDARFDGPGFVDRVVSREYALSPIYMGNDPAAARRAEAEHARKEAEAASYNAKRTAFVQSVGTEAEINLNMLQVLAVDAEAAQAEAEQKERAFESTLSEPAGEARRAELWANLSVSRRWWLILTTGGVFAAVFTVGFPLYVALGWLVKRGLARVYPRVLRFLEAGRFGFGGSARFATLFEEWAVRRRRKTASLFMGRSLYSRFLHISLSDARHMLTIAGSRAGKGTSAIIPNLLHWSGSALVIDPKGTNAAVTAEQRRRMGHDVHIVDPFNVLGQGSALFNPLAHLKPEADDIREQIGVIADAIVVADTEAREKHWDEGARTVVAGLIAHLISSYENPTLPHVRELLTMGDEEQRGLWARMSEDRDAGGGAREAANRVIRGFGTNEITGIISNADKHTEWLASAAIAKVLASSTFSFADLKTKPTTIYLILPPHYLEEHKRFLRLFVNLAIRQMSVGGRSEVPVLMILDEFLALGHMSEVEKAFGLMAGYNFVLWPFVQDLGRLRDLYKNSVNAFIANSRAVQVFGIVDEATTKFVSEQVGERSMAFVPGTQQLRIVPLRTPTEVAKDLVVEGEGRSELQYILRAGKAPLILEKVRYFEDRNSSGAKRWSFLPDEMRMFVFPFAGLYGKDPDFR